jgi:hypothetical protein
VAGYDTTSTVNEVWQDAKSTYGTPDFWFRYFNPCPYESFSDDPVAECQAIWDCNSSAPNLGPVTDPADLTGTSAAGQADAKIFVAALKSAYDAVNPLKLPTDGQLYCYLDQECCSSMSSAYWDGWAEYVNSYNGFDGYQQPLYACLYASPCCSPPNCSSICASCGNHTCYAIWTPEYQQCGYDLDHLPSFDFATCSGCGVDNGVATHMWQFAEQNVCDLSVNVDMDMSGPDFNAASHCFYLASKQ